MNTILNPDRTRKIIVSVAEQEAYEDSLLEDPKIKPAYIRDVDIFVENCPTPPPEMSKPRLLVDWKELLQAAIDAEQPAPEVWEEAAPQEEVEAKQVEDASNRFSAIVQTLIDKTARKYRYDDMNSVGKYLTPDNPFRVEAEALGTWTGQVWAYMEQVEADVQEGKRSIPTEEELLAELPIYTPLA